MGNLTTALIIVVSINMLFVLAGMATYNINPTGTQLYTCNGTLIGYMDSNGCQPGSVFVMTDTDPYSILPSGESSTDTLTGNIFTDIFTAVKNWFVNTIPGARILLNILSAPKQILSIVGLPAGVAGAFGAFWWVITGFLVVKFIFWGND